MSCLTTPIPQSVVEKFIKYNQLKWRDFTPERIASISSEIDNSYISGIGIQAAEICRIFYVYNQSRKEYEGICYHLFNLVATKDGKGHIYFVKTSDIGNTEFPVIPSKWHTLDKVVRDNVSYTDDTISSTRHSLESQWSSSSSSSSSSSCDSTILNSALSSITLVCSQLSKLLSKFVN